MERDIAIAVTLLRIQFELTEVARLFLLRPGNKASVCCVCVVGGCGCVWGVGVGVGVGVWGWVCAAFHIHSAHVCYSVTIVYICIHLPQISACVCLLHITPCTSATANEHSLLSILYVLKLCHLLL